MTTSEDALCMLEEEGAGLLSCFFVPLVYGFYGKILLGNWRPGKM